MNLEIIYPAFNYLGKDADFKFTAGRFRADYYCIYMRIQTTKGDSYNASLVLADNKTGPSRYEKEENGKYRFQLSGELLKFIYKNLTAEVEHNKTQTIPWGWGSVETIQTLVGVNASFHGKVADNDKTSVLGLIRTTPWDRNFRTMMYAIMACPDSTIQIYEEGVAVGPFRKPYNAHDVLIISVEPEQSDSVVKYYVNNELVYQVLKTPISRFEAPLLFTRRAPVLAKAELPEIGRRECR